MVLISGAVTVQLICIIKFLSEKNVSHRVPMVKEVGGKNLKKSRSGKIQRILNMVSEI